MTDDLERRHKILQDMRDNILTEIENRYSNIKKSLYAAQEINECIREITPELTQLGSIIEHYKAKCMDEYFNIITDGKYKNCKDIVDAIYKPQFTLKDTKDL